MSQTALTFGPVLLRHAAERPSRDALIFLRDGQAVETSLTYAQLVGRATAWAKVLKERCTGGDRAVILLHPGADYVLAILACLLSGIAAVPSYPTTNRRSAAKLQRIIADCSARIVLTTTAIAEKLNSATNGTFGAGAAIFDVDQLSDGVPAEHFDSATQPGDLALLQYTSGSTEAPKGVRVTQANICANQQMIREAFGHENEEVVVSWLPPYHDMGLIGCILQPLFIGGTCVLMPPAAFTQQPLRWLQAITTYRATTSGAPNFGYQMCVDRAVSESMEGLDLGSWRLAFTGAEPIRPRTLSAFAETFGRCGFAAHALYPCYGLAEATLFVTGERKGNGFRTAQHSAAQHPIVGCGYPRPGCDVSVVDPNGCRVPDGETGEIWVSGTNVAQGYWQKPETTSAVFNQAMHGGKGSYLRTGDVGFVADGQLFVTGRIKDVVIVRGKNYAAIDIERSIETAHAALLIGSCAVFNTESANGNYAVAVCEVRKIAGIDYDEVVRCAQASVSRDFGFELTEMILVRKGSLARTTSGKVEKFRCREQLSDGALLVVHAHTDATAPAQPQPEATSIQEYLLGWFAGQSQSFDPALPVLDAGVDSLRIVQLQQQIRERFGRSLPVDVFYRPGVTFDDLVKTAETAAEVSTESLRTPEDFDLKPASAGQRALWVLTEAAPADPVCHIVRALRFPALLDHERVENAFRRVMERHAQLRARFSVRRAGLSYRCPPLGSAQVVRCHRLRGLPESVALDRVLELCYEPFDLERGPLFRIDYLIFGSFSILAVSAHHAVVDLSSLMLVWRDFKAEYERPGSMGMRVSGAYDDFVAAQNLIGQSAVGADARLEWLNELGPTLRATRWPASGNSGRHSLRSRTARMTTNISLAGLKRGSPQLARTSDFAIVATALALLLHRLTGDEEIVFGTMTSGRTRAEYSDVVGYLANPVLLRVDVAAFQLGRDVLEATREAIRRALERQCYPYEELLRSTWRAEDSTQQPIDVMLSFQQLPGSSADTDLSALAMGMAAPAIILDEMPGVGVEIEERAIQFKIILRAASVGGKLAVALDYQTATCTEGHACQVLGLFVRIVQQLPEYLECSVSSIVEGLATEHAAIAP